MRCTCQRWVMGLLLASWLLATPSSFAANSADKPTLAEAVEGAWRIAVDARRAESESHQADAGLRVARSLSADTPSLMWSRGEGEWYGGAHAGTAREMEVGLSWPLWMPGQRRATIGAARADAAWARANLSQARQDIAAQVREVAWDIAARQAEIDATQSAVDALTELAQIVERRVNAGDLATSDLLASRADVIDAEIDRDDASRRLQSLQANWKVLTGYESLVDAGELDAAMGTDVENLLSTSAPPSSLIAAEEAVRRAEAAMTAARRSLGAPPELTLAAREESESTAFAGDRSLVLSLRVPLGLGARRDLLLAKARAELDVAQAELALARSNHATGVTTAHADFVIAGRQLQGAAGRAEMLAKRQEMMQRAFMAGDIALSELLLAHRAARAASAGLARRKAEQGLAHTRLLHVIGTIP